jgi:hypothetical protein
MIPTTPGRAGGAGIGSLKNENTAPTTKPVAKAKIASFNILHYLLDIKFPLPPIYFFHYKGKSRSKQKN